MRRWFALTILVSIALFTSGCGGVSFGCSASVEPGIVVAVFDSETKAPAADGAVATIRDGDFTQTLRGYSRRNSDTPGEPGELLSFSGADERSGTYTVRVEKAGYTPWEVKNVHVRKGDCHVETVRLEAYLTPVP